MEVRTPSDGFAATFPKGDGFYPDKLKFTDLLTARALSFQLSTMNPGIGVATRQIYRTPIIAVTDFVGVINSVSESDMPIFRYASRYSMISF